jgi:hypothetical protein
MSKTPYICEQSGSTNKLSATFTTYLEKNLYKNSGRRCGVFLCQPDVSQNMPRKGVSPQQMCEKLGHIPQLICFETMYHRILLHKAFFKVLLKNFIDHAKPLS